MLLRTTGLTLTIGTRTLLTNLHWQVNAGECWCIIGRNGAGKTTLLRHLAGLIQSDTMSNNIFINDLALPNLPLLELAQIRSYLPQGRSDTFAYRAIDVVLGARHPYHNGNYWESADDLADAQAALQKLDVADLAERDVRSLSGGERQRVAIAAVLAQDAQLMLLDEPTNSLDLAHQVSVMQLLAKQCHQHQKTVLMVSHDLNLVNSIATHVLLLMGEDGWKTGPVAEIMNADDLSQCLGHPIELIRHGTKCFFLPLQTSTSTIGNR